MKKILLSVAVLVALASFTSCMKCETCTGTTITTYAGSSNDTITIPSAEYCGDQLDIVKAGTNTSAGGMTVTTTYNCSK